MGLLVVGCSLFGVAAVLMLTGDSSILLGCSAPARWPCSPKRAAASSPKRPTWRRT